MPASTMLGRPKFGWLNTLKNWTSGCCHWLPILDQLNFIRLASYDASNTTNSILTSSLALTPAFPGGLIPKSVCFTVVSPV